MLRGFLISIILLYFTSILEGQSYEDYLSSYLKEKSNIQLLQSVNQLNHDGKTKEAEQLLDQYQIYQKCDFLNLQYYISKLVINHELKKHDTALVYFIKAVQNGYSPEYSGLPKWAIYTRDTNIDSLEMLYIGRIDTGLAVKLSDMLAEDQHSRFTKNNIRAIDSINKIRFDEIILTTGIPLKSAYGNKYYYGDQKYDFSLAILLIHFGENYWNRYLDTLLHLAYYEEIEWSEIKFLMNAIFIRASNKTEFKPIKYLGDHSFKEYLMYESILDVLGHNDVKIEVIFNGPEDDPRLGKFKSMTNVLQHNAKIQIRVNDQEGSRGDHLFEFRRI
ncbi:MAG: hypothetical protein KDC49_13430 [Saprospiraceae bacterium]|nr:hypothetical protein [Saprospiraceae bacterium]